MIDNVRYFAELCAVGRHAADEVIDAVDLRDCRTARCADLLLLREGRLLAHTTPRRLREETGCTSLEEAFLSIIRRTTTAPAAG